MRTQLLLVTLLASGCAHRVALRDAFQERMDDALAEPPTLRDGWPADATAWIDAEVVHDALSVALGEPEPDGRA